MTTHEKTLYIITELGIAPKKIAEIIGKSQSVVYDKIKKYRSNEFIPDDFEKLLKYILEVSKKIEKL